MSNFEIQTRQKTTLLFPRPPLSVSQPPAIGVAGSNQDPLPITPLAAGAFEGLGIAEIQGFAYIAVFGISDQPFTVYFYEAALPSGPFVLSQTIVSVLSGSSYVVDDKFEVSGKYAMATVANDGTSAQTVLSLAIRGVPVL